MNTRGEEFRTLLLPKAPEYYDPCDAERIIGVISAHKPLEEIRLLSVLNKDEEIRDLFDRASIMLQPLPPQGPPPTGQGFGLQSLQSQPQLHPSDSSQRFQHPRPLADSQLQSGPSTSFGNQTPFAYTNGSFGGNQGPFGLNHPEPQFFPSSTFGALQAPVHPTGLSGGFQLPESQPQLHPSNSSQRFQHPHPLPYVTTPYSQHQSRPSSSFGNQTPFTNPNGSFGGYQGPFLFPHLEHQFYTNRPYGTLQAPVRPTGLMVHFRPQFPHLEHQFYTSSTYGTLQAPVRPTGRSGGFQSSFPGSSASRGYLQAQSIPGDGTQNNKRNAHQSVTGHPPSSSGTRSQPCRYHFFYGHCYYGGDCKFSHVPNDYTSRTVFVNLWTNLRKKNFSEQDITDYFSDYGRVLYIKIPKEETYCFVSFKDPESVKLVLQEKSHLICNKPVDVHHYIGEHELEELCRSAVNVNSSAQMASNVNGTREHQTSHHRIESSSISNHLTNPSAQGDTDEHGLPHSFGI